MLSDYNFKYFKKNKKENEVKKENILNQCTFKGKMYLDVKGVKVKTIISCYVKLTPLQRSF